MTTTTCDQPTVEPAVKPEWEAVGNGVLAGEPRWVRLLAWWVDSHNRAAWWRRTRPSG